MTLSINLTIVKRRKATFSRTIKVCSDGGEKSPTPWKVLLNLTFNGF